MKSTSTSRAIEPLELRWYASAARPITIGSLGDSYTDEYHFYPPDRSTAQNWVEQLVHNHRVSFGTATDKSRGTPRDKGYADDWALNGATSADLPIQTAGLAAQAATGKVQFATILIGGNDFLDELETAAGNPATAAAGIATTAATIVTNIETAVDTLLASSTSLKIAVATLPPVSQLPIVASDELDPQLTDLVNAVDAAEVQVNQAIEAFAAATPRVAVADFAAVTESLVPTTGTTFKFGSVKINAVKPGDNPHSLFLKDGLHLGSSGQGLLANVFIDAIDSSFAQTIKPLTTRQILHDARLV